jgi:hypothetical protein
MAKLTLSDLASLTNEASAVATINANNALIMAALEKTYSRDGTSPNSMGTNLDMNSFRIQNLLEAVNPTEPVRKAEWDTLLTQINSVYANTQAVYDQFDDRFLGAKSSDPTLDNDGNSLVTGAIYFNTTTSLMKIWNGTAWQVLAQIDPKAITVSLPQSGENITIFYARDSIRVTQITSIMRGSSSPSINFSVKYASDRNDSGVELITGGITLNTSNQINIQTGLTNPTIPANTWVWFTSGAVSGVVNELNVTLSF